MERLPREMEFTPVSELFTEASLVLGIPLEEGDVVIVFPCEGEHQRVRYAVKLFEKDYGTQLIIAGTNEENIRLYGAYAEDTVASIAASPRCIKDFLFQEKAANALEQSIWTAQQLKAGLWIKKAVFTTGLYHLPRAFLTLLKAMIKEGIDKRVKLFVAPTRPFNPVFDYSRIAAEVKRIPIYQDEGHVATLEELHQYLQYWWPSLI